MYVYCSSPSFYHVENTQYFQSQVLHDCNLESPIWIYLLMKSLVMLWSMATVGENSRLLSFLNQKRKHISCTLNCSTPRKETVQFQISYFASKPWLISGSLMEIHFHLKKIEVWRAAWVWCFNHSHQSQTRTIWHCRNRCSYLGLRSTFREAQVEFSRCQKESRILSISSST